MRRNFLFFIVVLVSLMPTGMVRAAPLVAFSSEYKTVKTEHFQIHFHAEQHRLAQRVAVIAEQVHAGLEPRFSSGAHDTQIVLVSDSDLVNAFATTYGMDRIILHTTGPEPDDFARHSDWIRQLIEHEYVHILTLRPYRGSFNILFRWIVGLPPNLLTPDGLAEGYPVVEESRIDHMSGKQHGRLNDRRTLAIRDTLVLFHRLPSIEEAMTGTERWPYGSTPYLFGGRFVAHLRAECGEDALDRYFLSYVPAFFPDWRFHSLGCGDMEEAYDRYIAKEQSDARQRLADLASQGVSPRKRLTFDGGAKNYLRSGPESPVYFASPEKRSAGLYSLDDHSTEMIYRANSMSGFYIDGSNPVTAELRSIVPGSVYRNTLHRHGSVLFDDEIRREAPAADPSGNTVVFIRRIDPYIEVVQLIPDTSRSNPTFWSTWSRDSSGIEKVLLRLPDTYGVYQPAVSADGEIALVIRQPDRLEHSLVVCQQQKCEERVSLPATIASPVFMDPAAFAGNPGTAETLRESILFSSDLSGVSDIYALTSSGIRRLTRSLTGFRSPLATDRGLYAIGLAENGDEIFLITEVFDEPVAHEVVVRPFFAQVESDNPMDLKEVSDYSSLFSFRPFLNGVLGGPLSYVNAGLAGYDALMRHEISAGVGLYDSERSYTFASYAYKRFIPDIIFSYVGLPLDRDSPDYCSHYSNRQAISFCLGERRFSFQESQLSIETDLEFRLLRNRFSVFIGRSLLRNSSDLSTTRYAYQNLDLGTVGARYLVYYFEEYRQSISPERGFSVEIEALHHPAGWSNGYSSNDGGDPNSLTYERYGGRLEVYLPFFIDLHVPVLAGGISYLNGRDQAIQQDRLSAELPGIDPDLSPYGRTVQVWRLEYRFPIWLRRSRLIPRNTWFSLPSFGIRSIALAPFMATGQAYERVAFPALWVNSFGVTVNLELYAFYQPFALDLQYARGEGEAGEGQFSLGFSVGARPSAMHAQPSRPAPHRAYPHPSYLNR